MHTKTNQTKQAAKAANRLHDKQQPVIQYTAQKKQKGRIFIMKNLENLINEFIDALESNAASDFNDFRKSVIHGCGINNGIVFPVLNGMIFAGVCDETKNNCVKENNNECCCNKDSHNDNTDNNCCCCYGIESDNACDENAEEIDITIDKVIYNKPAVIIIFSDGTKSVAKCDSNDTWSPETGFLVALCKRLFGSSTINGLMRQYVYPQLKKEEEDKPINETISEDLNLILNNKLSDEEPNLSNEEVLQAMNHMQEATAPPVEPGKPINDKISNDLNMILNNAELASDDPDLSDEELFEVTTNPDA